MTTQKYAEKKGPKKEQKMIKKKKKKERALKKPTNMYTVLMDEGTKKRGKRIRRINKKRGNKRD